MEETESKRHKQKDRKTESETKVVSGMYKERRSKTFVIRQERRETNREI